MPDRRLTQALSIPAVRYRSSDRFRIACRHRCWRLMQRLAMLARGDATDGDGGRNKVLSLTLDAKPVRLTASEGTARRADNEGEDAPVLQQVSGADRRPRLGRVCVQPGTSLTSGRFVLTRPACFARTAAPSYGLARG